MSQYQLELEELTEKLKRLRATRNLTGHELSKRAGMSQSKISKIETGRLRPSVADIKKLTKALNATPQLAEELLSHAEALQTEFRTWRTMHSHGLAWKQDQVRKLEQNASTICMFHTVLVPGLLQTAEYARRVLSRYITDQTHDVARASAIRVERQSILYEEAKQFVFIVTESALRTLYGPPRVMVEQLDRMSSLATLPNVRFGFIPFSVEMPFIPYSGFVIYDSDLVVVETATGENPINGERGVATYREQFSAFQRVATFGEIAAKHVGMIRRELATF